MKDNFYALTDKAVEILNKRATKRFEDAKDEAAQDGFDELSVPPITRPLYDNLSADHEKIFLGLAQERYQEAEPNGE